MKLTNQQILDKVWPLIVAQPVPSIEGGICKYRLQYGNTVLKCAAGHLIPDDLYRPRMENINWTALVQEYQEYHELQAIGDSQFIAQLQAAYDDLAQSSGNKFIEYLFLAYKDMAEEEGLIMPVYEGPAHE